MTYTLTTPPCLEGIVRLPASKSISNRALVIYALAGRKVLPDNLSDCDDTRVMVSALESMPYEIDIKAAGTAMRFMTAYLSVTTGEEHVITGTERMRHRPIRVLVEALRSLGAEIDYLAEDGFPPLRVKGNALRGGELCIAGDVSSQYISALLMIGSVLEKGLTLCLTGQLISLPYIEMTLRMMRAFGADAQWLDGNSIQVRPKPYRACRYTIESDWSAASYWYEMMALDPSAFIELEGLYKRSAQGDAAAARIFSQLGVGTRYLPEGVSLFHKGNRPKKLSYDFVNEPDLAQTFVVTCVLLNVPFYFWGLQSLRIKETDRIAALKRECRKLGYVLDDRSAGVLAWDGERCEPEPNPQIATYEDHRMAMAFAPAALVRPEGITIQNVEVVSKSYPHFWDDLKAAGFQLIQQS